MPRSICVIGDSISGGVVYDAAAGRYIHCADSFINLLGSSLGADIRNRSRFGNTVSSALRLLPRAEKDVAECGDTLVMLGGNDSDFDWPAVAAAPDVLHDCNTPLGEFVSLYGELLDRLLELGGRPIMINMIPVYGRAYYAWFSRKSDPDALMRFLGGAESIEHWNEMYSLALMKLADARSLPILDARTAFLRSRRFDGMFSVDGIHPSPEGHRAIFEYILPQAEKLLG